MRFEGLDLNLLVILDALLDERSVTKASVRLNVSQPAVSAALAKLRWHTGDQLLQKVGRNVQITPRAREMAAPIKDILIQIKATISDVKKFDPKATDRQFNMAMSSYCAQIISPILNRRLTDDYPNITYAIENLASESIKRVKNNEIDICVTSDQLNLLNPRESLGDISYMELFVDNWVLISDPRYCEVSGAIDMEDFLATPYIETRFNRDVTTLVAHSLSQLDASPQMVVLVPEFHLALTNVIGTGCISIVPSLLIDKNLLQVLRMQPPPFAVPPLHETLIWHSRNDADPGHKWFRELILEIGRGIHIPEMAHQLPIEVSIPKARVQPLAATLQ